MSSSDGGERRPARLLQPRQRILFQIYKKGPIEYNVTQLSKGLGYAKSGWTSDLIHELLEKGWLVIIHKNEREFIKITRQGRHQIRHLLIPRALVLAIIIIAFLPLSWAAIELDLHTVITPITLLVASLAFLGLGLYLLRQLSYLDKELLNED
ncbi:MAG: hypothetical protein JRN52_09535 [Nitrososphaerota archaeon]|nr:hypothetical protein [Nitrososphaerota archaeon]